MQTLQMTTLKVSLACTLAVVVYFVRFTNVSIVSFRDGLTITSTKTESS